MTAAPEVTTAAPPDLHPDALLPHAGALTGDDAPGAQAYLLAREAMGELYASYGRIAEAVKAIEASEHSVVSTPAGLRLGRPDLGPLVEAAQRAFERTARLVDARLASVTGDRDSLAKRLDATLTEPSRSAHGIAQASEIRTHLRSLTKAKVMETVHAAASLGDRMTVAAVLTAPPYLSGLDAEAHGTLRKAAMTTLEPRLAAAVDALDAVADRVRQASQSYVGLYARVRRGADAGPSSRIRAALKALTEVRDDRAA